MSESDRDRQDESAAGSGDDPGRDRRIADVIADVQARRAAGEPVTDEQVTDQHRDLMPELGEQLLGLAAAEAARQIADPEHADTQADEQASPSDAPAPEANLSTLPDFDFDSQPALHVPGYKIVRRISYGGQAHVYLGIHEATSRKVALKVMREGPYASDKQKARFDREVQILASLDHPGVVKVTDRGQTADGSFYFAMDYIEGPTLDEWLGDYRHNHPPPDIPADPAELLRLFMKIADAVNAAHLRGIVHRDLKPANIRIDERGEPHVLDFGLARSPIPTHTTGDSDTPEMLTITGQFLGSLPWSSPEQAEGISSKVDTRSDVYAMGVVLYQMLTGEFPYEVVGNMRDVLDNIMRAEPTPPSQIIEARLAKRAEKAKRRKLKHENPINDNLEAIVLKALSKHRDDRYQTAGGMAKDIGNYLAGKPTVASTEIVKPKKRRGPVSSGHWRKPAGIAALLICVVALTAWVVHTWDVNHLPHAGQPTNPPDSPDPVEMIAVPEIAPADGWVDVVPMIDFARDVPSWGRMPSGIWRKAKGGIVCDAQRYSKLTLPYDLQGNYDVVLRLRQVSGTNEIGFDLPIGAWGRLNLFYATSSGNVGLRTNPDYPTRWVGKPAQGIALREGASVDLRFEVRAGETDGSLKVYRGSQLLYSWAGPIKDASTRPWSGAAVPQPLSVFVVQSSIAIESARLQAVGSRIMPLSPPIDRDTYSPADASGPPVRMIRALDQHAESVTAVAINPQGSHVASGTCTANMRACDIESGAVRAQFTAGHDIARYRLTRKVSGMRFANDDRELLLAYDTFNEFLMWPTRSGASPRNIVERFKWNPPTAHEIGSFDISSDGKWFASGMQRNHPPLSKSLSYPVPGESQDVDPAAGLQRSKSGGWSGWSFDTAIHPDNEHFVTVTTSRVELWHRAEEAMVREWRTKGNTATCANFTADGNSLVVGMTDGSMVVLDFNSFKPIATLRGHRGLVTAIEASPATGLLLSAGTDGKVVLWDVERGVRVKVIDAHEGAVTDMHIDAAGKRFVTGSNDRTVKVWEIDTPDVPATPDSIDLLALVDTELDAVVNDDFDDAHNAGRWRKDGRALELTKASNAETILFPLQITGGYEFSFEATHKFMQAIDVILPIGDRRSRMKLAVAGTNRDDSWIAFSNASGLNGKGNNPTQKGLRPLVQGRANRVLIRVTHGGGKASIRAEVNGEAVIDWTGPMAVLSERDNSYYSMPGRTRPLGLVAVAGRVTFRDLKLRVLDGEARRLRPDTSATGEPVDLLAGLDTGRHPRIPNSEEWKKHADGSLTTGSYYYGWQVIPYMPPAEYRIEATVLRESGSGELYLAYVLPNGSRVWWRITGVEDKPTRYALTVKRDRVTLEGDGRELAEYTDDFAEIDGKSTIDFRHYSDHYVELETPRPASIVLNIHGGSHRIKELKLTPLEGTGRWIDPKWSYRCDVVSKPPRIAGLKSWRIESRAKPSSYVGPAVLAVNPDGKRLAIRTTHRMIHIVDPHTGRLEKILARAEDYDSMGTLAWSRDGRYLAGNHFRDDFTIWDAETWKPTAPGSKRFGSMSEPIAWSPVADRLAVIGSSTAAPEIVNPDTSTIQTLQYKKDWGDLESIAWSPDGKAVVTSSRDNATRAWDATTGELRWAAEPTDNWNYASIFIPDGKTVINSKGQFIDAATGEIRETRNWASNYLALSPDGKRLAISHQRRGIVILTGAGFDDSTVSMQHPGSASAVAWLPDGRLASAGFHDGTVRIWSPEGDLLGAVLILPGGKQATLSPDGHFTGTPGIEEHLLYIATTDAGEELRLTPDEFVKRFGWKNNPSSVVEALTVEGEPVDLLKLVDPAKHPQTRFMDPWVKKDGVLTSAQNNHATLAIPYVPPAEYRIEAEVTRLVPLGEFVLGIVTPEGKRTTVDLGRNDGKESRLGDLDNTTTRKPTFKDGEPTLIECTVRRGRITVEVNGQPLIDFKGDTSKLQMNRQWRSQVPDPVTLFVGRSGSQFRISKLTLTPLSGVGRVVDPAWSYPCNMVSQPAKIEGVKSWRIEPRVQPIGGQFHGLAVSPDGQHLAIKSHLGPIHVVDPGSGRLNRVLGKFISISNIGAVAWSYDGRYLAGNIYHSHWYVWDTKTWKAKNEKKHYGSVLNVASWSPKTHHLAVGGYPDASHVVNADLSIRKELVSGGKKHVRFFATWSPDGNTLVSGGYDKVVRAWDPATGSERWAAKPAEYNVMDAVFTPDGKRIITTQSQVLDAATGKLLDTLDLGSPNDIVFSPDGKVLATCENDGSVYLRTGDRFEKRRKLIGHNGATLSLCWLPDGRLASYSYDDGAVRFWSLEGQYKGGIVMLPNGKQIAITPDGHVNPSDGAKDLLLYIVETDAGEQLRLTPDEFAERFGWRNDPEHFGHDLERGLVGHWKFDEGIGIEAKDSSGHGHHGKLTSAVRWVKQGRVGGAIRLDNSNQTSAVYIADSDLLDPAPSMTICTWVKAESIGEILNKRSTREYGAKMSYRLGIDKPALTGNRIVRLDYGDTGTDRHRRNVSGDREWVHIAAVEDAARKEKRIYITGQLADFGPSATNHLLSTGRFVIGSGPHHTKREMTGLVDDVRIYSRVLSESEIAKLAESTPLPEWTPVKTDGLAKAWPNANEKDGVIELVETTQTLPNSHTADGAIRVTLRRDAGKDTRLILRHSDRGAYALVWSGTNALYMFREEPGKKPVDLGYHAAQRELVDSEWIAVEFTAHGPHLSARINGRVVATNYDTTLTSGSMGLGVPDGRARFKDIAVRVSPSEIEED